MIIVTATVHVTVILIAVMQTVVEHMVVAAIQMAVIILAVIQTVVIRMHVGQMVAVV